MKRVLCLIGSCLIGMVFILSVYNWLTDFGANIGLIVVSFVLFAGLLGYTVYDVLSVVDDLDFYKDKCRQVRKENAELEENYNYACEQIKHLNDYIKEDSREIARLRKLLGYY